MRVDILRSFLQNELTKKSYESEIKEKNKRERKGESLEQKRKRRRRSCKKKSETVRSIKIFFNVLHIQLGCIVKK